MFKITASISTFLTVFSLTAQLSVYESPRIEDVSPEVYNHTQKIIGHASADADKVRVIYTWITRNISYDEKALKLPRLYHSSVDVLQSGKAICYGFSQLFRDMCVSSGLESYVVTGYAYDATRQNALPSEADHAWNAVLVEERWRLVDATWGSGQNRENYLFVPHVEFAQTHIPSYYAWRLTSCSDARWFEPVICGLNDSLALFLGSETNQRAIIEAKADYLMNPSERNRMLLGQAIINRAVDLKERADISSDTAAISFYDQALELFKEGQNYQKPMFGWQSEAWAFAILNRANILYNALDKPSQTVHSLDFIIKEYKRAIAILTSVKSSFTSVLALTGSREQVAQMENELNSIKR